MKRGHVCALPNRPNDEIKRCFCIRAMKYRGFLRGSATISGLEMVMLQGQKEKIHHYIFVKSGPNIATKISN
jgi:hypothetical protein